MRIRVQLDFESKARLVPRAVAGIVADILDDADPYSLPSSCVLDTAFGWEIDENGVEQRADEAKEDN